MAEAPTCAAVAHVASPLHATTPPSAIATRNATSAAIVRTRSAGYASHASTAVAARSGSATSAIPQCVVPSSSTALMTTRPTAVAPAMVHARKTAPGSTRAALGRFALATLLTEPPSQVVEGPGAGHVRHVVEVVRGRRRRRVPLERVRLPRVVSDSPAAGARPQDVDREEQDRDRHDPRADRGGEVVALPLFVRVRVHAPGHALEPDEVLRHERDVEADEEQPELPLAELLVEHAPEHLRPPVEEPGEAREHDAAEERVVEVRDHDVAVVHLPVDRERSQVDAGEPADDEEREEAEREQHRRLEAEIPAPQRGEPVEDLDPGRHRDDHRRDHEEGLKRDREPHR